MREETFRIKDQIYTIVIKEVQRESYETKVFFENKVILNDYGHETTRFNIKGYFNILVPLRLFYRSLYF